MRELEREMSAAEYLDWQEFETLEPFGSWRDNWHAAMVATILANAFRSSSSRPSKISDFMYIDPESAQAIRDNAAVAFFDSKVRDG